MLMEAVCAKVTCFVPLDTRPVEVPVESVGVVSVPFGDLRRWRRARPWVSSLPLPRLFCFAPLCASWLLSIIFLEDLEQAHARIIIRTFPLSSGEDPTQAVAAFLRQAAQAGALPDGPVDPDLGARLLAAVCDAGRGRAAPGALAYCHRPLDLSPFTLQVRGDMLLVGVRVPLACPSLLFFP